MAPFKEFSLPNARPYAYNFPVATTALIIIDMQRDFVDPNGFGSIQCGNPEIHSAVRTIVPTIRKVLDVFRGLGMNVIHTREGHRSDLSDLPPSKRLRQISAPNGHHTMGIGDVGPMGRLLVRGEWGHDIIDELKPFPGEVIIDKPGKGSFWDTGLHRALLARGITHLIFSGVTTECCVTTTLRECHDRGFECCILDDCTGGFDQEQVSVSMDTICGQDGLFGFIGTSSDFFAAVSKSQSLTPPSTPPATEESLVSIGDLSQRYRNGLTTPDVVVNHVFDRIEEYHRTDPAVWVSKQSREEVLATARALSQKYSGQPLPPLFGIPFAVKDNLDMKGVVTTAGLASLAYVAESTASAVQLLLDAGALYIGKLNMDQLATGLSGCRSPYGNPHSVYSKEHISGGSSSGTGVAVGAGLISFALGTDTAGSGRLPAAFNGVIGFKPTKGTVSARGMVPACKSLDTVSIMAPSIKDARKVWYILDQHDHLDPYAKLPSTLTLWRQDFRGPAVGGFRFAIPPQPVLDTCSPEYQRMFQSSVQVLRSCGGRLSQIDYTAFSKAADLLYEGSLVYERIASIGPELLVKNMETLHPTTKALFQSALNSKIQPWQVFEDQALQAEYTRQAQRIFDTLEGGIDVLFVPSAPCHPTIEEMNEEPLVLNAKLGTFTHFANVIDLCAVSANAGFVDRPTKLPMGVTFLGGSGYDGKILDVAALFEQRIRGLQKGLPSDS